MWDLVAFQESASRASLAAGGIAVPAGEDLYQVNGDDLVVREDGVVFMAGCITAAIANLADWQFHQKRDAEFIRSAMFLRDQTGAVDPNNSLMRCAYPVKKGEILIAQANNGANAQVESVLLGIAYGGSPGITTAPIGLPMGARWIYGAGGTAAVANTWTQSTMTWDFEFQSDKNYQVLAMIGNSATGYAARLKYKGGSTWKGYAPGIPLGDTNILVGGPFYGDFGQFEGLTPPDMQVLCSGTDAAQAIEMLILEG